MPNAPVTTFRLESTLSDASGRLGLQARVADPAWMLARQLQMGEFAGEDAGTPAAARIWASQSPITRLLPRVPDGSQGRALTSMVPLEAQVENEIQPRTGSSLRLAALAAADYARRIAAIGNRRPLRTYRAALAQAYPLTAPAGTDPILTALAARTFDGQALYRDLSRSLRPPSPTMPATPPLTGLASTDRAAVLNAARAFLAWYDAITGRALDEGRAWRTERLEYQVSIAGPLSKDPQDPGQRTELVLAATECDSSALDWYDFDIIAGNATLGANNDSGARAATAITFLPAPARYRGQPATRFWELEDHAVHFAAIEAAAEDLATLLVIDFAVRYSDDYFVVPLPVSVGTIVRVGALDVTDTFGRTQLLPAAARVPGALRAFEHTAVPVAGGPPVQDAPRESAFVLFPAVATPIEGEPVEVLGLVRDELANICWAIERTILSSSGTAVDQESRASTGRPTQPPSPPPADADVQTLRYVPREPVPPNWYQLLPRPGDKRRLEVKELAPLPGEPAQPQPRTRLLWELRSPPARESLLADEEVTRTARDVVRAWQYARATNGAQLLWLGRRVRTRVNPGTPPLEYDTTKPAS